MNTHIPKAKIMVVDDIEINRLILEEILSESYEVEQAADGMEAISMLLNSIEKPHLMLLDVMMPGMDGYEVISFMKNDPTLKDIPVIFITAVNDERRGLVAGAVDYITKPFDIDIVRLRVATQIELNLYRCKLESLVEQKANELIVTKERFLDTMANLIEYRSLESGQHVNRTRSLAQILVTELLKTEYADELINCNCDMLVKAVPLHDIGKIAIPDDILLKPGKLTDEEFKIIETHTIIGSRIIQSLKGGEDDYYLKHCYDICRWHHEKWNGKGYPDGLSGRDIPLSARIVAVVDVYDALVSVRCYKKSMSHEEAIKILEESAGSHTDSVIIGALLRTQHLFKEYETSHL